MTIPQIKIQFVTPYFRDYIIPVGWLSRDRACHALWYYYILAHKAFVNTEGDPMVLEGDRDPDVNYKQLLISVATAYGTTPEAMIPFWHNVDMQCDAMGLGKLPNEDRFRWNVVPEIRSQ